MKYPVKWSDSDVDACSGAHEVAAYVDDLHERLSLLEALVARIDPGLLAVLMHAPIAPKEPAK